MTDTPFIAHRRADILRLAQHAVEQRGQRRLTRRRTLIALVLIVGVTTLSIMLTPRPIGPSPAERPPLAEIPASGVAITRVATTTGLAGTLTIPSLPSVTRVAPDPSRIARLDSTPAAPPAERLTDSQALALLKEAGTPAGLIKIEGRVMLVYHERERAEPGPSSRTTWDGVRLAKH